MDPLELSKIVLTLSNIDNAVSQLAKDSSEADTRLARVEQQVEVSNHTMRRLESDWSDVKQELRGINEKLQSGLSAQAQNKSELDMVRLRVDLVCKVYDEKISKLEKIAEESRMALWKLISAGAGSGALISGLIEVLQHLVK